VEGFDPAINYGPNDAGISALTIILGIIGLIAISWLFGKIYGQVSNFFEKNGNNDSRQIIKMKYSFQKNNLY
tara:strand:+ start:260 stop:475 length:216 start_codon:yes stop_codon:yes gene_type:complete